MLPAAKTPAILRDRLRSLCATESMAGLSRRLGKRPGYIRDLLKRSDDAWLEDADREFVERYFGLGDGELTAETE